MSFLQKLPYLSLFVLPEKHAEVEASIACSLSLRLNTVSTTSTNKTGQTVCSLRGKIKGEKHPEALTAACIAFCCEHMVITEGDSDEHLDIFINPSLILSAFCQYERKPN